jgi:hypothetical protein
MARETKEQLKKRIEELVIKDGDTTDYILHMEAKIRDQYTHIIELEGVIRAFKTVIEILVSKE